MELIRTINYTWKLCVIASLFGCLFIFLFLNENYQDLTLFFAGSSVIEFTKLDVANTPKTTIVSEPQNPYSMLYTSNPPFNATLVKKPKSTQEKKCNMFDGRWVYKPDQKPCYDTNTCPFIEEKMNCQQNGRPDFEYEKWRWEAKDCEIPLFNGRDMLERLNNKRLIMVGDSLNRNMWESLACLLYTSVPSSTVEVDANGSDYKVLKAKDYNAVIEFYWSPFLIEFDKNHKSGKNVLVLDKISLNSHQWQGADIMVFNSGHWYTHTRKLKAWELFQYKGKLSETMSIDLAYDRAMKTWAKWIEEYVIPNKTNVIFRSISGQHTSEPWCYNYTQPFKDDSFENAFPKSLINIIESLIEGMSKVQVKYLNITKLTDYRIDAHSSVYWSNSTWKMVAAKSKQFLSSYADCIHWCLPGLPDTWNELLYATLYFNS
ncbi:protein trichome birefringence-like [Chenopodium quinoa]|uniref:protein trichome birefringence-like n=1 Tax=Chenopodium quinoa TaxID=63459 RepID=UPI000B7795ED|nr:protein trichome birefringence-like [Chenopodium quinoa]